jgi:DNA-binding LacI/PurR family transcriptional regulator
VNRPTSLTDIAKLAGVSPATVSYALNGNRKISADTTARILKIAQDLNYHPSKIAQGLRTRQSKIICMLISSFESIFNGALVEAINKELHERGYALVVIANNSTELINAQLFDGLIVFNYTASKAYFQKTVSGLSIPVVMMANKLEADNAANIIIDNRQALTSLCGLYGQSDHRQVCFFTGPEDSYNAQNRLAICQDYFKANYQLDITQSLYNGHFDFAPAYKAAKELLATRQYNFFFCLNDVMAHGVYRAAEEAGLKVGQDISVVGFDNIQAANPIFEPKLTTADANINLWSQEVVTNLLNRVAHKMPEKNQTTYIPTMMIPGDSVHFKS